MKVLRGARSFRWLVAVCGVIAAGLGQAHADAYQFTLFNYPGANLTYAEGINNQGAIFGIVGEPYDTNFLYQNGSFQLFPGIVGINNVGMILVNTNTGPAIFYNGMYTPLTVLSPVVALNDTGSLLIAPGYVKGGVFTPINYPGSATTTLRGINDSDAIVGSYTTPQGNSHAFLYENGVYKTIDFPGAASSAAYAINNNGEVVGNYFVGGAPVGIQGFTYENGVFQTVDAFNFLSEETATFLTGINDAGEIVGYQTEDFRNATDSFVATPVPEPGSLALLGTGVLGMAGAFGRRFRSSN